MKIVVICPTYNEKENMEKMIPMLVEEIFPKIKNHQVYLLIADDRSPDGTGQLVKNFIKKYKQVELLEGDKEGLGAAYVRAMKYAMDKMHADAVIEFDADFQHDPNDIPRLVAAMDEGYDYIIGSRYIHGGRIPKEWGFERKIKSVFGSLFARIVLLTFRIHDMTSGFKLTKTSFLKKVDLDHLYSKNYAYKMQILYEVVKLGAKIKEVPIIFYERKEGKSKMDTNDLYDSFTLVIKLRLRDSQRLIKFLIVGTTGFIIQVIFQELSIFIGVAFLLAKLISVVVGLFAQAPDLFILSHAVAAAIGAESAIIANFTFNNIWTFSDTKKIKQSGNFFVKLAKFNTTSFAAIFIQFFAVWIGEKILGTNIHLFTASVPTRIAILFPTIIFLIIPLNYIIYNKIIWKTQHLKHEKGN